MVESLKRTPLYDVHVAAGARVIDFGGWEMPVQYTGILEEHRAVRQAAGLFDLCHMGEFRVTGPQALDFVQMMTTNDAGALEAGQVQYSMFCGPDGGIVDDILVYREKDGFFLVVNASNTAKDFQWLEEHLAKSSMAGGVKLANLSDDYALIAIQGPRAAEILQKLTPTGLSALGYYHFTEEKVHNIPAIIARTGYTGEDGFEIYITPAQAAALWHRFMEAGQPYGLLPIGLGARDTLRLEMKYTLYGNDIGEDTTPLEAGIGWAVKLDKGDFIGRDALLKQKAEGVKRKLVGFKMTERGIPRSHYPIQVNGRTIGHVTSGSMSPTLGENIGLGYVEAGYAPVGTRIAVEIRGKGAGAQVVRTPFVESHIKK
ncbi:MAG: glycine cleavage system aminomethyltransferase GcvT [Firmicutes bacterium]|nr:glycine cleavage system aminomethyltransferase GcvT [Bacillota bacterium]